LQKTCSSNTLNFMSGHNKWTQIKHKKAKVDQGKSKLFSKLAQNISIAAKEGIDPKFNPSLRNAIDQAKHQNMPHANIERAIKRASEIGPLENLVIEVYGPEGVGVLIEVMTDSRNRSIAEIRAVLKKHGLKMAEPGSLMWAFEKSAEGYIVKFKNRVSSEARAIVGAFLEEVEEREDVVGAYSSLPE